MVADPNILCPFCNSPVDVEMFNGMYGCDTGCDYVRFEVECPSCKSTIYDSGTFGDYTTPEEEAEYYEEFMTEFAEEVQRINARRKRSEEGQ